MGNSTLAIQRILGHESLPTITIRISLPKTLAPGSWYTQKHSIPDLRLTKERCRSKKGKAEHILKP